MNVSRKMPDPNKIYHPPPPKKDSDHVSFAEFQKQYDSGTDTIGRGTNRPKRRGYISDALGTRRCSQDYVINLSPPARRRSVVDTSDEDQSKKTEPITFNAKGSKIKSVCSKLASLVEDKPAEADSPQKKENSFHISKETPLPPATSSGDLKNGFGDNGTKSEYDERIRPSSVKSLLTKFN